MQGSSNCTGNLLDPPYSLDIQFLGRELDCRVSGMDSCIFNVLRDGVGDDLSLVANGIEL